MELSACIVVYNGWQEAVRAAQSLLEHTRRYPLTLYLVDKIQAARRVKAAKR